MDFSFPEAIQQMCRKLLQNNFQAYLVGGCVRDVVLGKMPHDYDIATNAKPEEIISLFGEKNCSAYGRAFGTVGVKFSGSFAEMTTFRTETDYWDYRHPQKVQFAETLEEDLCRRDFTCNAMAYDVENQKLIDLYGGVQDLQNKILRCVGVPSARFREDALRILRGMRFCARLGLKPDLLTDCAMRAGAFQLKWISAERIYTELCEMLMGKYITDVLLAYPEILCVNIPEIAPCIAFTQHTKFHDFTVWEHIAKTVGNSPENLIIRLTMLFHDIAKPQCYQFDVRGHFYRHAEKSAKLADNILLRLKADNATRKQVTKLIACHRKIPEKLITVRRLLNILTEEEYLMLIQIFDADRLSKKILEPESRRRINQAENLFQRCVEQNICCRVKELAINGNDLKAIGFEGEEIGKMLNILLEAVYHNLPNERKALLTCAERRRHDLFC